MINDTILLDEALEYLNNNTTDFITFYKNQIMEIQNESVIFSDFDVINEKTTLYGKIQQFEAFVTKILTKLKMFIQKIILKIRSYVDKTIVTGNSYAMSNSYNTIKNNEPIKIQGKDVQKINDAYSNIADEIMKVNNYMVDNIGDMVDDIADFITDKKEFNTIDDFKKSFISIKKNYSNIKEGTITISDPASTLKNWSEKLSKASDQLNDAYNKAQKNYKSIVNYLKETNNEIKEEQPGYSGVLGYKSIQACTKLVNIATDEIMFAASIVSDKVVLYGRLLNSIKANNE